MCFSPKVSTPKAVVQQTPIEPAPLKDDVAGVQFGDGSSATDKTGTDTVKIDKDNTDIKTSDSLTNNSTSASDIKSDASKVGKSIKRKEIFGGKK